MPGVSLVSCPALVDGQAVVPGGLGVDGVVDVGWPVGLRFGFGLGGGGGVVDERGQGLGVDGAGVEEVVQGGLHVLFG